jgi:hypothetical protein
MRHDWRGNLSFAEKSDLGFHILSTVRQCRNCGSAQLRESLYGGCYGRSGPKVTGYQWLPLVGRCKGQDS